MLHKTILTISLLGLAALTQTPAADTGRACDETRAAAGAHSRAYLHSSNLPGHGVAIEGFSPVSYFAGKVERGSALFAVEQDGITYHLTDARQVAEFRRSPERYVPAFGGWCAFGMAVTGRAIRTTLGSAKRDRWVRASGTTRVRASGTT